MYSFILIPDSLLAAQYVIQTLDKQPLEAAGHLGARCDFSQHQQYQFQAAGFPIGQVPSIETEWQDPRHRPPHGNFEQGKIHQDQGDSTIFNWIPATNHETCLSLMQVQDTQVVRRP